MTDYSILYTNENFQKTIEDFCEENQWQPDQFSDNSARIVFQMPSGRTQTLMLIRAHTTLVFLVFSHLGFSNSEGGNALAGMLLQQSAKMTRGFWCVDTYEEREFFCCRHNADTQLVSQTYFTEIVSTLVMECEKFDEFVEDIRNS